MANAIVGTAIGFLPAVVLLTYFGAEILDWFAAQSLGMWVAVGATIMTFVIVRRIRRRASSVEASLISTLPRLDG